uniref:Triacylglycerol lipase n=1 Tax=Hirondellea gigas TaxID=1518452 RepID=A0A6A7G7U7_9CRUS
MNAERFVLSLNGSSSRFTATTAARTVLQIGLKTDGRRVTLTVVKRSISIGVRLIVRGLRVVKWLLAPHLVVRLLGRHLIALLILLFVPRIVGLFHPFWRWLLNYHRKMLAHMLSVRLIGPVLRHMGVSVIKEDELLLYSKLKEARSYKDWVPIARQLDEKEGKYIWKNEEVTTDYDVNKIKKNIERLRRARESQDTVGLRDYLRSRLLRNVGGIGSAKLYQYLRHGTRTIIEEYIYEVIKSLRFLSEREIPGMSITDKLHFFTQTRHAYGRSALLLSGGGTLGLYHAGVVKALMEAHVLPRIISGSSVGSLFAAFIGTCTDSELWHLISTGDINFNFFPSEKGSTLRKLKRLFTDGVLMDINILQDCIRSNLGDCTFGEAYERTGRVLNITVSVSSETNQSVLPRLLNHLTAPNVLIWTAACASCAIPYVYGSVELKVKTVDGTIRPYDLKGVKFSDGTLSHDLPMQRIAELFNVNHFIVSQCNPHVVPLIQPFSGPKTGSWFEKLFRYLGNQCAMSVLSLWDLGIIRGWGTARNLLYQQYEGHITFVASVPFREYSLILSNPTKERLQRVTEVSQRNAWPRLSEVQAHCDIEFCLDECVQEMRGALIRESQDETSGRSVFDTSTQIEAAVLPSSNTDRHFERKSSQVLPFGNRISSWTPETFAGYKNADDTHRTSYRIPAAISDNLSNDDDAEGSTPTGTSNSLPRTDEVPMSSPTPSLTALSRVNESRETVPSRRSTMTRSQLTYLESHTSNAFLPRSQRPADLLFLRSMSKSPSLPNMISDPDGHRLCTSSSVSSVSLNSNTPRISEASISNHLDSPRETTVNANLGLPSSMSYTELCTDFYDVP